MKRIQPGELDQQVSLYSSSTAQDSYNQPVKSFALYGTVWARVIEGHGTDSVRGDEVSENEPITVVIRHGTGVDSSWKLNYNSEDYRITSVRRIGRDHWTEIKAERIGASESGS